MDFKIMLDPEKYGYIQCKNCNGYGSSLKESSDKCSVCGGSGLVKKTSNSNEHKKES